MPKKSKKSKKSNSCNKDSDCNNGDCCGGKCYGPDAEDRPDPKKCYQEADFEFGKEEEYEEVVGQRGTKGCNIWAKGMQVYNKSKVLFGDVLKTTAKNVTVSLYTKDGEPTNQTATWQCKNVSQTAYTETINKNRRISKTKKSTTIMKIKGKGRLKTQDGMKNQQIDTIEGSVKGKQQNEKGKKARESRESEEQNLKNRKMIEKQGKYRSRTSSSNGRRKRSGYQDLKF